MSENTKRFEELENKIHELITSHQKLKTENEALEKAKLALAKALETEKARLKWVEDGYNSLKQADKKSKEKSIGLLQKKLNDIVSEVDKNISLVDTINT